MFLNLASCVKEQMKTFKLCNSIWLNFNGALVFQGLRMICILVYFQLGFSYNVTMPFLELSWVLCL
jgi:hypothetical protein